MNAFTDYATRADQLMLRGAERTAFIALNLYADEHGTCPECRKPISRYESDRCTHARTCKGPSRDERVTYLKDDYPYLADAVIEQLADVTPGSYTFRNILEAAIPDVIATFPPTFKMRGDHGGDVTFRISARDSFVSDTRDVMLYTEVLRGDRWLSYAKGTVAQLRRQVIPTRTCTACGTTYAVNGIHTCGGAR